MRLVAVSRVLNEDDIVEAFVRHHAALVDHHVLLDNGSTDRTLEILRALHAEGLNLTVVQNRAPSFSEIRFNTSLFRLAVQNFQADWVLHLDCDEFLDERQVPGGLRARLADTAEGMACLHLPMVNYYARPQHDAAEPVVPCRLRWRDHELTDVLKICARGGLAAQGVEIDAGNHEVLLQGRALPALRMDDLPLAHYPHRSPWQEVAKCVIGRLKVLAAGRAAVEAGRSIHYTPRFETIRDNPASLLREPAFIDPAAPADLVEDPIDYAGGELRHTRPGDAMMKAIAGVAAYAETLAQQHGRLIDGNEGTRLLVDHWASIWAHVV